MSDAAAEASPGGIVLPEPSWPVVLRSVLFTGWLYGTMVAVALACLPLLLGPRSWTWVAARGWVRMVEWGLRVIVGCRVEVRGREHVPAGGRLIAGKHMAMLDTIAPLAVLPDSAYVIKRELMRLPFWGWYAAKLDMIPVDRSGGSATLRMMMAAARERVAQGRQILIFPEGTRVGPGAAPDYKPGVAGLYRELSAPVVPMATNSGLCWPAHGFIRRPGLVVYEFLPAIPVGLKRAAFMGLIEETLERASDRLLAEGLAAQGRRPS